MTAASVVTGTALGLLPIAAACRWWPAEVTSIFNVMLRSSSSVPSGASGGAAVCRLAASALVPGALFALAGASLPQRRWTLQLVLVASDLLLFRCCPPVLAFAVFFCLWHSPEHLVDTSLDAQGRFDRHIAQANLRRGLPLWGLTMALATGAALYGRHTLAACTGLVFIALSALTVPHMALHSLPAWIPWLKHRSVPAGVAAYKVAS